ELTLVDTLELLETLGLLVNATESSNRAFVGRIELVEDHAIGAHRIVDLTQALLVHSAQASVQLDTIGFVFCSRRSLLEHARQLWPLLEGTVDAIQVGQRIVLRGGNGQHV